MSRRGSNEVRIWMAALGLALLGLGAARASSLPEDSPPPAMDAAEPASAPGPAPAPPSAPEAEHGHETVTEPNYGPVPGAELLPSFSEDENRKLTAWALVVQAKVEKQWKQPPQSASRHPVQVSIELLSNGSIANVRVTQSSGDAELDRSVLIAVLKAGPLPALKDKKLFEKVRHKVVFSFRANGSLKKTSWTS